MTLDNITYTVLNCVRLEGGIADADGLVTLALAIVRRDAHSAAELHLGITNCLVQGWIKVLTREDCLADRARWTNDPHQDQDWVKMSYKEGSIDFTQTGWEVFVRQHQLRYGGDLDRLFGTGSTPLWDTPGRVSLLCVSENTVLDEIAEIRCGKDDLRGESLSAKHHVTEIIGPYPIGPWWVNRFYQAPQAYRADISYQPSDP